MKKVIIWVLMSAIFLGCSGLKPNVTKYDTKGYDCLVYTNDMGEFMMKCFKK